MIKESLLTPILPNMEHYLQLRLISQSWVLGFWPWVWSECVVFRLRSTHPILAFLSHLSMWNALRHLCSLAHCYFTNAPSFIQCSKRLSFSEGNRWMLHLWTVNLPFILWQPYFQMNSIGFLLHPKDSVYGLIAPGVQQVDVKVGYRTTDWTH